MRFVILLYWSVVLYVLFRRTPVTVFAARRYEHRGQKLT
jgi:hypothetical protein